MNQNLLKGAVVALASLSANVAVGETWYCALRNDPTVGGGKVEEYSLDGNVLRNLTEERVDQALGPEIENMIKKNVGGFRIVRNDKTYLVAERDYQWKPALNIEMRIIRKDDGAFTSILINAGTPDKDPPKPYQQILNGSCTQGN